MRRGLWILAVLAVAIPVWSATGGPDGYGYYLIDSGTPGGPAYDFEDISATGTTVTLTDDSLSAGTPMGFLFNFYGANVNVMSICSNGFLTPLVGQSGSPWLSAPIPTGDSPNALIAGWWNDFNPQAGGAIYTETRGTAPNRRFLVQFQDVPHYNGTTSDSQTVEYKIFESDNSIEVHYARVPYMDVVFSDDRHCAGIENAEGNFGLSYHYDASPLDTPVAVRYYMRADALRPWLASPDLSGRAGGPFDVSMTTLSLGNTMATSASWAAHSEAAWLDIVPAFGTVGGNTTTTAEVRVGAAAASLLPGVYSTAVVCSNTATGAEWVLGVELEVLDPLEVSPEGPYAWAGGSGGPIVPEVTTVTLSNFGAGAVNWAISGAPSWLQASTGSGSLNGNASSTIALSVNPSSALLAPGHYAGTVSFDNLTHGTSQEFDVTLDIVNLARVPVFEDFESPALADYWTIGGSGESRTTVTTAYDPCAGSRHLTMDTPLSGVYARNELTIGVDVGNRTGLTLSFLARDYGDESHPPASDTFTGGADFDGVAISGDGETWHVVQHLTDAAGLGDTCTTFTVDLDAAMASSGLAGAELLFVRFNQYDNYPIDQDGIAIDNVSITGAFTGGLTVTPSETFLASGAEGGPILPAAKTYVLTNTGGTASVWSAESDASWLDVSPTTGSVAAMSTATLRLATAASVNLLTPGLHVAQVRLGEQSGAVQYVNAQARVLDRLNVSPEDTWHALGIVGGPFYPTTRTYTVSNAGALPTAWRADVSVAWLRVSPSSGTLNGGVAENVTVRIEDSASSLSFGTYDVPVVFTNLDSGAQVLREVSLRVSQGHLVDLSLPAGSLPYATVWGDDAGDMLGYGRQSMAFGDVNGDGYDDLIVGAPYGSPGGRNEAGEVTVVYGNAAAAGASIDLDTDGAISVAGETRILGDDADDRFGWSVASGDVNGDGIDDIVIGAPFANVLFTDPAGEVVIVYGRSDLPGRVVDLNTDGAVSVEGETRILGDEEQDQTGYAVAVGDVDGDGRADVIMGAPRYDTWWTYGGAGQVIVVNGASGIEGRVVDLDTDGAVSAWGEVRILGDDANDQFGVSVASGDVNGDGYADVVVGAPRMRQASGGGPGEAYVVYGGTHMASATLSLDTDGAISAWGETRVLGDDADDAFGWSVASGDVNGDGFDDVVIGAPVATVGGLVQCGEVAVVYGGVGLSTRSISLDTDGAISVENETRIRGGEDMAEAGISVAVVDGNGDGVDDVIVGMPGSSPSGGGDGAGMVAVVAGGGDLPGDIVSMTGAWGWARIEGAGELDSLGMATGGGGDMNRDGAADFAAGAPLGSGTAGYGVVAMGESATTEALRTRHSRAGDAPVTDFGPVVRCAVDFDSGDASTDIVTIERVAPSGLSATGGVLPVNWRVLSTRGGGWTASLSFRYTDVELDGRTESGLRVLMSPTGAPGSWFVAGTGQAVVASMNRIDVSGVSGQGYFAIVDGDVLTPTPTPTPTTSPTPTATPSPTPTPTSTGIPANTWFEEAQTVSLTSDGHFYAAAYNLTQNTFLDSVDTSFSATLDISVTDGDWLGLYVYDYSDGVWTRGLYVLKDAL